MRQALNQSLHLIGQVKGFFYRPSFIRLTLKEKATILYRIPQHKQLRYAWIILKKSSII